jgi:hypothetical protein
MRTNTNDFSLFTIPFINRNKRVLDTRSRTNDPSLRDRLILICRTSAVSIRLSDVRVFFYCDKFLSFTCSVQGKNEFSNKPSKVMLGGLGGAKTDTALIPTHCDSRG